jgi:hypothetical protein
MVYAGIRFIRRAKNTVRHLRYLWEQVKREDTEKNYEWAIIEVSVLHINTWPFADVFSTSMD